MPDDRGSRADRVKDMQECASFIGRSRLLSYANRARAAVFEAISLCSIGFLRTIPRFIMFYHARSPPPVFFLHPIVEHTRKKRKLPSFSILIDANCDRFCPGASNAPS